MRHAPLKISLFAAIIASGCSGRSSSLNPIGEHAKEIADLWWIFFGITGTVYLLVITALAVATFRRRNGEESGPSGKRLSTVVGAAVASTVAILFALLFFSTMTGRALAVDRARPALRIEITGHQWWWDVEYDDPVPVRQFKSANEIYIPVGKPVELSLQSRDVIHSFWIPSLHGKRDLIPGHTSSFIVRADQPGTWEGQCAEFCGLQHAKMRLLLTALPESEFNAWADSQRRPARPPRTAEETRGQAVFMASTCAVCHTIKGTPAGGTVAPDLTHIASRRMLAANSLPNVKEHMAAWITDSQQIKPGNRMPSHSLSAGDLQALVAYLGSLE